MKTSNFKTKHFILVLYITQQRDIYDTVINTIMLQLYIQLYLYIQL